VPVLVDEVDAGKLEGGTHGLRVGLRHGCWTVEAFCSTDSSHSDIGSLNEVVCPPTDKGASRSHLCASDIRHIE
jgi:hypothetical protein